METPSHHDNREVLEVQPSELTAVLVAIDVYRGVIQGATQPTAESTIVLTYLHTLRRRCKGIVRQIAEGKEQRTSIPMRCSARELLILSNAIEIYTQMERLGAIAYRSLDGEPEQAVKTELDLVGRLLAVMRRYFLQHHA